MIPSIVLCSNNFKIIMQNTNYTYPYSPKITHPTHKKPNTTNTKQYPINLTPPHLRNLLTQRLHDLLPPHHPLHPLRNHILPVPRIQCLKRLN